VLTTVRNVYDLFGRDQRGRWAMLVVVAIVVSGLEMVGAALVYTLLSLVVDPTGSVELPVLGDVRALAAGIDDRTLLLGFVTAMAGFFVLRSVVKIGALYVQSRVAHNAGARLASRLVEGYLRWPYAAHLRRSTSESIRNAHQVVNDAVVNVVVPMIRLVAEAVLVAGLLVVLVALAPAATALAVLVVGGAAALLLVVVQPRLKQLGHLNHVAESDTLRSLQQALHGLRDVKLLGREAHFAAEYGEGRFRMARSSYLRDAAVHLLPVVIETALLGFILLYFAIAILRGNQSQETLSVLGLFGYAGLRLQPSLQVIVQGLNSLKYSSTPLADVRADLAAVDALSVADDAPEPLAFRTALVMEAVSFRYEAADRPALTDVNLTVRPGQQIGICGPTGGGKTTLVDLMTGLLEPSSGRLTVDGVDLREHARAWQRNLGVVPQMVFLTDDTLRRNIALGVADDEIDEEAIAEAIDSAQLREFVGSLPDGLDTVAGERGVRLSGGQRQRIAIARALYHRPSVLVFDEGTSALDNATESLLMSAIERLRGDHTIILIAHRLSTVRTSDCVLFIEAGRISGQGTYDDLVRDNAAFRAMAASTS
jgi:ATP-binding cassette, subfamily B, bacterial PglK